MKIGLISDVHAAPGPVAEAIRIFRRESVDRIICAGDIADEILDVAEEEKAEIIVLGRRGLGRVREVLLGSVSHDLVHKSGAIVMTVP